MDEHSAKESDVSDYIGGAGNISHLWEFIDYFEKKLEPEISPYKDWLCSVYFQCPNFAAWIRFYPELICTKAMVELNRAEKCKDKIKSYNYGTVTEKVIEIAKKEREKTGADSFTFESRVKALKLTVELRHTLQHGGIPNVLRNMIFKEVSKEDVNKMVIPQNYLETKKIFQNANLLIEMLPRPKITIHSNGKVEFKEAKGPTKKGRL